MNPIVTIYDDKEIRFLPDNKDIWITQKEIAQLFDVEVHTINYHIKSIIKDDELDNSSIRKYRIVADDGRKRTINHYNLDMVIAIGYRVNSKKATKFRKWATTVLTTYLNQGVAVNPKLAEANPEKVQDNFYTQFSPSMKKHLNKHGHTRPYQEARLENIAERKALSSEIVRTVDGKPNFGAIMGMFHISLTGKTKKELLRSYDHMNTQTTAVDTLGSIVVNQINYLMQAVRLVLEQYPDDYIPNDVQVRQIERIIKRHSEHLRAQLQLLSDDLGVPIEHLGNNSRKNRLL